MGYLLLDYHCNAGLKLLRLKACTIVSGAASEHKPGLSIILPLQAPPLWGDPTGGLLQLQQLLLPQVAATTAASPLRYPMAEPEQGKRWQVEKWPCDFLF